MASQIKTGEDLKRRLLQRIFEEGSVTREQMKKIVGLSDFEIEELIEAGHVKVDGSYFGGSEHFLPARKAKKYLKDQGIKIYVKTPRRAPLKNEKHDGVLTNVRLTFEEMGYKTWQSERCLKQRGMREFIPDGILELGRRKIAIELELSNKSEAHYRKRFKFYEGHPAIDAVLYIVATPHQRQKFLRVTEGTEKIYIVMLRSFTEHGRDAYVERAGFAGAVCLWKFLELVSHKRFVRINDLRRVM